MKAKITCVIEDCDKEIELAVAPPDRSVGIMGATIEEVSGSCEHVEALNAALDGDHSLTTGVVFDLYEALEESYEDYEPSEKDMEDRYSSRERDC